MKKILSPIIYTLSVIPVFFLILFSISVLEKTLGFHTIWRIGDIDAFIILVFFGLVIFGLISYFLLRFEAVKHPKIMDHMRYSSLLYISFIIFFTEYIWISAYVSSGLGVAIYTTVMGVLFTGIIVNAITLFVVARKNNCGS